MKNNVNHDLRLFCFLTHVMFNKGGFCWLCHLLLQYRLKGLYVTNNYNQTPLHMVRWCLQVAFVVSLAFQSSCAGPSYESIVAQAY